MPSPPRPPFPPRRVLAFIMLAAMVLFLGPEVRAHGRSAALLSSFAQGDAPSVGHETELVLPGSSGPLRAREYVPPETKRTCAHGAWGDCEGATVVLVHGVHRKGIDEPRLMRFSRSLSASGIRVVTPEVRDLANYRVTPGSVTAVGDALRALARERPTERLGLMGMSFGGGIAVMTAADPRYRDLVSFVVSVGGHNDMERVARFFVTHETETANGGNETRPAHDYGAMVLVHARIDDFFPSPDREAARQAVTLWLWEEHAQARAKASSLSEPSRRKLEGMFEGRWDGVRDDLLRTLAHQRDELRAVSPHLHVAGLRAPLFILHGEGDTVVPKTEAEWMAKDAEGLVPTTLLISPSIKHVELNGTPGKAEAARLVHFMAEVLRAAERG